jgi:hypothetical protein
MTIHTQPAAIDSIKKSLVALKIPRALEMLDVRAPQTAGSIQSADRGAARCRCRGAGELQLLL